MITKIDIVIFVVSALICWSLAAWMFWKWDIPALRSEREEQDEVTQE